MIFSNQKVIIITLLAGLFSFVSNAQKLVPFKLQDTGQTGSYTSSPGEDADYFITPPSFTDNGDGTVTDNNTLLMWQKADGGEMTYENAISYAEGLSLGGYGDWRLPTGIELFSLNNYNHLNPALDTGYFTPTEAQYWWSSETQADDPARVWVVNAGGGIGAHPKSETISAGGTKRFQARAVRTVVTTTFTVPHFTDLGDGTVKDNFTGLVWQKVPSSDEMTWEEALSYGHSLTLGGRNDWRVPNVKELQSLNDVTRFKPSFNTDYFPEVSTGNFWSSTSMINAPSKAWDINVDYGIVSYSEKSLSEHVILVRGGMDNDNLNFREVNIPGGEYEMGDHIGHYDPSHPNDEIPIHLVKVDSFNMAETEVTNAQYLAFLNASYLAGDIQVTSNRVHLAGDTNTLYYTHQDASFYSIGFDGNQFSMADFRALHPVNGVMWNGAVAFCNWLSTQNGLGECYDLATGDCDFSQEGYRLATEAEWEYAGRGGHTDPYLKFENGNTVDVTQANLPNSGDPYETGSYPLTTPAGFYDGTLKLKSDYIWPSGVASYQTSDGKNGFGLYDMQGNVWELINDWYGNNYYSSSPYDNPTGPSTGSVMPDGKPYRSMRGGNWYNGIDSNNVNDGHSRVSNRDPSYFRGPDDPHHPWYHVGFRTVRKYAPVTAIGNPVSREEGIGSLLQNYPNPFSNSTTIRYFVSQPSAVTLRILDPFGREVAWPVDEMKSTGWHSAAWDGSGNACGVYFCIFSDGIHHSTIKLVLLK